MRPYRNLSGNSGVVAYELGDESLVVAFAGGAVYRYTYASSGRANVEHMKRLAQQGRGLSSFIARQVRNAYAERLA